MHLPRPPRSPCSGSSCFSSLFGSSAWDANTRSRPLHPSEPPGHSRPHATPSALLAKLACSPSRACDNSLAVLGSFSHRVEISPRQGGTETTPRERSRSYEFSLHLLRRI